MFDLKCVYCKSFNPKDGCRKNLEEENCLAFEEVEANGENEDKPSCGKCVWSTQGFCDFDFDNPETCRRFKNSKEDL